MQIRGIDFRVAMRPGKRRASPYFHEGRADEPDRDGQGTRPRQAGASVPGDQIAVRLSEDPAAGHSPAAGRAWRSH
jgi:hypothetical protein